MVIEIPELFGAEEVRAIRARLEAAEWGDGLATAGHRVARVKANEQLAVGAPLALELGEAIVRRLSATPLFVAATLPRRILPPRFSRYEGRGHYGEHIDNAIFPAGEPGEFLRADVSATLFLSDPDNYEGGELAIEDTFGTKTVKLPAGHLVVYPASSMHRVAPVTSGVRLAAFLWVQSFVPSVEQRRLLFELDNATRGLAADHPEHASVDRLTGVYHNLLRQWSQT